MSETSQGWISTRHTSTRNVDISSAGKTAAVAAAVDAAQGVLPWRTEAYWDREKTRLGQVVNDVLDKIEWAKDAVLGREPWKPWGPDEDRMKADWRAGNPLQSDSADLNPSRTAAERPAVGPDPQLHFQYIDNGESLKLIEPKEKNDEYWKRELTPHGRQVNDALDKHERYAAWKEVQRDARQLPTWALAAREQRYHESWTSAEQDKNMWRGNFQHTGKLEKPEQIWKDHADQERMALQDRSEQGPRRERVTTIKSGPWQVAIGGGVETKVDIGHSERGFHFRTSMASLNSDGDTSVWSKAYKTQGLAEYKGATYNRESLGETWHMGSGRQEAHEHLAVAAILRGDRINPPQDMGADVAAQIRSQAVGSAKYRVAEARETRLANIQHDPFTRLSATEARVKAGATPARTIATQNIGRSR